MSKKKFSLTIQVEEKKGTKYIALKAIKPERFTHYGFGTFLEKVIPTEVSITQEALDVFLNCPERTGLQGLEFWKDNRLSWGSPSPYFLVPFDAINVPSLAKIWVKEMCLV